MRRLIHIKHVLIAPPLIFFLALSLIPLILSVYFSLTNTDISGSGHWIGIDNYRRLFSDQIFLDGYKNTLIYVVSGVAIQYLLGLGLALLVHSAPRGQRLVRFLVLLPLMVAPLIVGFLWTTMLDSRQGPVDDLLRAVGLGTVPWLTQPTLAFISVLLVDTWQWTPFMFLILYAGLRTLPVEPFEAARVDGASPWRIFRDLTFPMLLPASIVAILLRGIEAFKLFDIVYFLTGGGPGSSTSTTTLTAYFTGLRSGNLGYGAAMTVILLLTVIVVATAIPLIIYRLMNRPDRAAVEATRLVERERALAETSV